MNVSFPGSRNDHGMLQATAHRATTTRDMTLGKSTLCIICASQRIAVRCKALELRGHGKHKGSVTAKV